jgi:hypothetical protein
MSSYGGDARDRLGGPAIALMVTAILGILAQIGSVLLMPVQLKMQEAQMQTAVQQKQITQEQADQQMQITKMFGGTIGVAVSIVGILIGILIFVGALKMKSAQSYGLAMTSSILAMIPCLSPCCLLGLPFGIWALVVLSNPEVKAAFR